MCSAIPWINSNVCFTQFRGGQKKNQIRKQETNAGIKLWSLKDLKSCSEAFRTGAFEIINDRAKLETSWVWCFNAQIFESIADTPERYPKNIWLANSLKKKSFAKRGRVSKKWSMGTGYLPISLHVSGLGFGHKSFGTNILHQNFDHLPQVKSDQQAPQKIHWSLAAPWLPNVPSHHAPEGFGPGEKTWENDGAGHGQSVTKPLVN